jgi:RNA polymerase sigma-70 factor (ECF subfamily)
VDYSSLNDETLLRLIGNAHSDALNQLYQRYSSLVFGLALRTVGNSATAEEITLDVFTRVWQKAETYRSEQGKVSTWLMSITRNLAIDTLRRQNVRPEQYSVSWTEISRPVIQDHNHPERATELAMQQEEIRAAVAQLPPEQRQVLGLAYFAGYTHSQIADLLDQPLGTVKTRIRLAMQKLRQILINDSNVY